MSYLSPISILIISLIFPLSLHTAIDYDELINLFSPLFSIHRLAENLFNQHPQTTLWVVSVEIYPRINHMKLNELLSNDARSNFSLYFLLFLLSRC
jgi:hypothetical protein